MKMNDDADTEMEPDPEMGTESEDEQATEDDGHVDQKIDSDLEDDAASDLDDLDDLDEYLNEELEGELDERGFLNQRNLLVLFLAVIVISSVIMVAVMVLYDPMKKATPLVLRESPTAPWDLSGFKPWKIESETPLGNASDLDSGIREVNFADGRAIRKLYVHFPDGFHAKGSLPCVLVPPSGSNLITGQTVNGDVSLLNYYLNKRMIVVTYELNGALHPDDADDPKKFKASYLAFVGAKAGLVNSRNAFEYAANHVEAVDPSRIFVAGYSSGGSHALLFAAHEPRLAGCVAYCPDPQMGDFTPTALSEYGSFLPGLSRFVTRASPMTHIENIDCRTLVFAVQDDEIIEFAEVKEFCDALRRKNGGLMFRWTDEGGHSEAFRQIGLKWGADWIETIAKLKRR